MRYLKELALFSCVSSIIFMATANSAGADSVQDYIGVWHEDAPMSIIKVLSSNHVRGCGQFEYKFHKSIEGRYFVRCTRDGSSWVPYVVNTTTNKVKSFFDQD